MMQRQLFRLNDDTNWDTAALLGRWRVGVRTRHHNGRSKGRQVLEAGQEACT